jgi:SAM-dependent methyltransferase
MERNVPAYYDNLNTGVLDAIPAGASTVLEIGCGAGRLGSEYKKRHPEARYYGVEIDAQAAAIAGTRLDMALCGSIEKIDLGFLTGEVDCIVYADVLEHLIDPWRVVADHRALLKNGGVMIACIPNIQHWGVLRGLLAGQWTYQDNGLLDRTHLRFFTANSIHAMFTGAGLQVESIIGRNLDPAPAEPFFQALAPVLPALGVDPDAFHQQANVFQYLVTARRKDGMS